MVALIPVQSFRKDVRSLSIPIPDVQERRRQAEIQGGLLSRFDACCVENQHLARTCDELLPLLMSGKLRVKDAESVVGAVV